MLKIKIAHAASDENGWDGYEGSKPGDQTGKEIRTDDYLVVQKSVKFTQVLRWKRMDMANAFATRMHQLADNANAGYSQPKRGTGVAEINADPDPSHINRPVEFDCSSAASSLAKATIESCGLQAGSITGYEVTAAMFDVFMRSGFFDDATSKVDMATGNGLVVGDIVLKAGVHVAAVISVTENVQEAKAAKKGKVVNTPTLTLRTGPGTEYQPCGIELLDGKGVRTYIERGETFEIMDDTLYWYKIKCSGKYVWYPWVSKRYMNIV